MEDKSEGTDRTSAPSSNSEAFAELSRLARESTSSWEEDVPGRETDRAFLLLIVIAIILLSGIIMVGNYRQQISDKFDELKVLTHQPVTVEKDTDNRVQGQLLGGNGQVTTGVPSGAELERKVRNLEDRLARLQQKMDRLEASSATIVKTPPGSTPASTITLLEELPKQRPELIQTQPEPAAAKAPGTDQVTKRGSSPEPLPETNHWYINLAAYSQLASAKPLFERTQQIATADIQKVISGTRTVYRVRAIGYPSAKEARKDAQRIESLLGLKGTWISNK